MRPDPEPKPTVRKATEHVLLYAGEKKIQPRRAKGRFQNLRIASMLVLLGVFYVLPWLSWNGTPLVWLDLPHRRFHLFGLLLVPQDLILLSALLLVAALTLFFFTTLAGRLWCGYACPQTVWTEAFLQIEHWCEGDRHARLKLDKGPWNAQKILRRGSKHVLWLALALFTGLSFVAYFVPAHQVFAGAAAFDLSGWTLFWVLFYGFLTWGNAGFMREQVCKYMCPYARFQSSMFDRDTLIIAYDEKRGEPRKTVAKKSGLPAGDCTDCSLCVQVCPTGIDIRKGLQYECIACAACVDVCDSVMDSVGKPRGLIHYSTAHRDAGKTTRWLRPRAVGYGLVWLAACAGLLTLLVLHEPLRFDVLRDRHALYRELRSGALENSYVLKVTNEDDHPHRFHVSARFADGTALTVEPAIVEAAAGKTLAVPTVLRTPAPDDPDEGLHLPPVENVTVSIVAEDRSDLARERAARFLTGSGRN